MSLKTTATNEPVGVAASVLAVVNAAIAAAVGFDLVDWTPEQIVLLTGLVNTVLALPVAAIVRSKVTPNTKL